MANWPRSLITLLLSAFLLTAADAPKKSALDKPTLEAYLRHLNLWNPQVTVQIEDPKPSLTLPGFQDVKVKVSLGQRSADLTYLVSNDGQKILQANVYDISWNPFREDLAKLKTEGSPSLGTPGATVVIVLFSDFQCSFCREEAKILQENLLKAYPTQVRLYFKDFPLEALHPWAKSAAEAGRCVYRQNQKAFWDYHDWIFDKQADMTVENLKTKIVEWGGSKNLDTLQLSQCIDTHATAAEVESSIALAKDLHVNSTPTMFLNGRRLTGKVEWQGLKTIIDGEIEYQKTAKNAGEDCGCVVELPSLPGAPQVSLPKLTPQSTNKK